MKQFLTFSIDNIIYAFEVICVQEVLEYSVPAKIPCAAVFIEGLINSRNQGISLINLRKRFGLPPKEPDKKTRIIVIELPDPTTEDTQHIQLFGAMADSVNEVVTIEDNQMEPPPKFGSSISPEFISGMSKVNDVFVSILNPEKIFTGYGTIIPEAVSSEELEKIAEAQNSETQTEAAPTQNQQKQ